MKIRVLVITPTSVDVKMIEDDYKEFKRELEITSPVQVIVRKIGRKEYDLWIDDEGLFKDDLHCVDLCTNYNEILCGNIIICNEEDGKSTSLDEEDVTRILQEVRGVGKSSEFIYRCSMGDLPVRCEKGGVMLVYEC